MKETFYITTPIYFPNDKLHIGHTYTTVAADFIARYKKIRGYDVHFLTGTDEHGQKIERTAKKHGMEPIEYLDGIITWIKELWNTMDIEYDDYIRTTETRHTEVVQKIFKKLYDKGDIYKSEYEGNYCVVCEAFYTKTQLEDGKCPECGSEVEKIKEESYFFKLSKYQDRLMKYIDDNPDFIQPESRKNEMINNFLKPGLEDLSVSRTSFDWGIPVTFDDKHVIYVWIDALSNYISALGYMTDDDSMFKKYWPADVHLMAKEIVRFHSIIWPIMLMALDLPLPKKIFAHGWLVFDGRKMSKSFGNVVNPKTLVERYGVDAIRFYLMKEIVFGQDGNFTNELLIERINSDLANDLGNLLSRTIGMIDKYFNGQLPEEIEIPELTKEIKDFIYDSIDKYEDYMDNYKLNDAVDTVWKIISRMNKYTDEMSPWHMVKDDLNRKEVAGVLYTLAESLRIIGVLISPLMPNTSPLIFGQLNVPDENKYRDWDSLRNFGMLNNNIKIVKGDIIFPRLDLEKEIQALKEISMEIENKKHEEGTDEETEFLKDEITIDDFGKIELKIGEVISCEKVKKSDKLLKSQIKIGTKVRQIVSGIAEHYTPEEMIGKKVSVVTNLKPVKIRGILSEGMLLAASNNKGELTLIVSDKDIEEGATIS